MIEFEYICTGLLILAVQMKVFSLLNLSKTILRYIPVYTGIFSNLCPVMLISKELLYVDVYHSYIFDNSDSVKRNLTFKYVTLHKNGCAYILDITNVLHFISTYDLT